MDIVALWEAIIATAIFPVAFLAMVAVGWVMVIVLVKMTYRP